MAEAERNKFPELPSFPTTWGEQEEQRLQTLAEQKKRMDELFQRKLSPEAWEGVPAPERAFRGLISETAFEPLVRALTPWQWGFDYGMTPEQARKRMFEAEEEYRELIRMQRVVNVLPSIQNTLRVLALTEMTIITTREDLDKYFKLTRIGFTEEEQAYVVDFAKSLLGVSKEDLVSGGAGGLPPITPEEIARLIAGETPIISPNQIMSTVAFSKDIGGIQDALQMAYPPIAGEIDQKAGLEKILQDYIDSLKELGVDIEEGDTIPEMASKAFEALGEDIRWAMPTDETGLPLIDPITNEPIVYIIDKDNYAWYGNDIIGYYDEKQDNLVPLSLSGEPILTEAQRERVIVDWGQAAFIEFGFNIPYMGKQYILNAVPMFAQTVARAPFGESAEIPVSIKMTPEWIRPTGELKFDAEGKLIRPEVTGEVKEPTRADILLTTRTTADPFDRRLIEIQTAYKQDYLAREERYMTQMKDFFTENPEFLPRPEWDEPMIERFHRNPKELLDVGYVGYQMATNIHTLLAIMASIGVTYVTKNPTLGMMTAATLFVPLETESLRQDLMASGATYEQATGIAVPGGLFISSLECIGNIPIQRVFAPQFFAAVRRDASRTVAAKIMQYGIITPGKVIATETFLEEVPQEIFHNAYVQAIDKNRHLLENIPEVVLQSLATMAPLGFMGGGSEYLHMKHNLQRAVLDQLEEDSQTLQDSGIPKEQADLLSYNKLTETEAGRAAVELAIEELKEPLSPGWDTYTKANEGNITYDDWARSTSMSFSEMSSESSKLEEELKTLEKDIEEIQTTLRAQEDRLEKDKILGKSKAEMRGIQEIVDTLNEQLTELEARREKLITSLLDMKKAMGEVTPIEEVKKPKIHFTTDEIADLLNVEIWEEHPEVEGYWVVIDKAGKKHIIAFVGMKEDKQMWQPVKKVGEEIMISELPSEVTTVEPEEVQGIPMPEYVQQGLLAQADEWLNQVATRKPNAIHVIGIADGEAIVRTDNVGRPFLVVTLHMREGKLTLDTIVSAEPKTIANGKALLDVINYLRGRFLKGEVAFPPEAEMSPDTIPLYRKIVARMAKEDADAMSEEELRFEEAPEEAGKVRLPREISFKSELEKSDMAVRTHPDIARNIKLSKQAREIRANAERTWEEADEEARLTIAKNAGLSKTIIAKDWSGMSRIQRGQIALSFISDGSLHFNMAREIADMEEFMEFFEEVTDLPFTLIYERSARAKCISESVKEYIVKEFSENPEFRAILQNNAQLAIATQELNARNEIQGVEHPEEGVTPEILALVEEIQRIYDVYKPFVRYLEFMRTEAKLDILKKRFPDAVKAGKESELIMALELRNRGQFDSLWQFLKGCTWGVYEFGFDPRQIASPELRVKDVPMGGVIGSSSLHMRTKIEFPGTGRFRRNLVNRMLAYVTQMEIQWELEPELRNFQKLFNLAYYKFENRDEIKAGLDKWWGLMQGIPSHYGWWSGQAKRVWRQAMTAIFLEPVMSVRNFFQAINLGMDRTELVRWLVRGRKEMSPTTRMKGKRFFDIFVSQLGGLRKYVLLQGQPGIPGLGWLNKAADTLNIYGWSDYLPRLWSFFAYFNKATRATQQFQKDNNVEIWLKNSGAIHLRQTERNFVLSHYLSRANDNFDLRVAGLEQVTGAEMASFYVARRNTDRTHFKYARWARGMLEMGNLGETMWNLFVFPRGYGQRVAWQAEKIVGLFKGEATWEEARSGFGDLIKLFIVAQLFSSFWKGLTGRKRNPYDPFSILTQWTFGGLFIGAMIDLTKLLTDSAMAVSPLTDPITREQAKGRLPGSVSDLAEMLVPFYRRIIDVWAAMEDTPDQDVYWLRKMREQFEKDYTTEELEKLDMTLWEKMKKAALGANPPTPDAYEKSQKDMQASRDLLGTRDTRGRYYTVEDHASVVSSATRGFPDIFVSDYAGSHELDIFYKDCETQWEEYYYLPSKPSSIRKSWRFEHPEEEAMMLFWGKLSNTEQPVGSEGWEEVFGLLIFWAKLYRIDKFMFPEGATWKDEVELGLDLTRPE